MEVFTNTSENVSNISQKKGAHWSASMGFPPLQVCRAAPLQGQAPGVIDHPAEEASASTSGNRFAGTLKNSSKW